MSAPSITHSPADTDTTGGVDGGVRSRPRAAGRTGTGATVPTGTVRHAGAGTAETVRHAGADTAETASRGQAAGPYRDRGSTVNRTNTTLLVTRLGTVPYTEGWELQRTIADLRRQDRIPNTLLLLEHPHTYTLGRRGKPENILLPAEELARRTIAVHHVDRGGDVTYHGPGQLVGYPILKLPPDRLDYVGYIRDVESALLLAVRDLGVSAELQEGYSGIWIGNEKVCAIGVKIDASGVTMHGFAINVRTDLSYFGHIIPCGLTDKGVTSLDRLLSHPPSMRAVMAAVVRRLAERFDLGPRTTSAKRLHASISPGAHGDGGK